MQMALIQNSALIKDKQIIQQCRLKRTPSKRVVQDRTLLNIWGANCDSKLLLFFFNPNCPDIGDIEDVRKYVVAYTGKRHQTTRQEIDSIQMLITRQDLMP